MKLEETAALERKQALRKMLLARRKTLDLQEWQARCAALERALLAHPIWLEARGLAAFVGVRNEPRTTFILERSLELGKQVWLPRVLGGGRMRFWPCEDLAALEPGRMGLREPAKLGEGIIAPGPEDGVDLILVPGLGFGRDGARLGFGAGHYDRALATQTGPEPILCGVCLEPFLDPVLDDDPGPRPIPMLAHDRRMDYVVSDRGVERCRV